MYATRIFPYRVLGVGKHCRNSRVPGYGVQLVGNPQGIRKDGGS